MFKLVHSLVNVEITFLITFPFALWFKMSSMGWVVLWIGVFFLYNIFFENRYGRCPGMMICGSYYSTQRSTRQKLLYVSLYVASFSTLLFYIWFPLDLLLINLSVQLIFLKIKKNTLHGYIGGMRTRLKKSKSLQKA
jgi:hypothetical protein